MVGYLLLAGAIVAEIFATSMLKLCNGFTALLPTIACILGYVACFYMFGKALNSINLSVGYAVWCAVGIVATTLIAVFFFGDKLTIAGVVGILLIVVGVVVLNLFGTAQ